MGENENNPQNLSAGIKREAIRRTLEGEDIKTVSRELGIPVSLIEELVGKFLLARHGTGKRRTLKEIRSRRFKEYQVKDMSEIEFPEMFEPIQAEYLRKLSPERARELMIKQAIAQEKVGYERHTKKYFLPIEEDPFPEDREAKRLPIISPRELLIFLAGLFGGVSIIFAVVALGLDLSPLGWMPTVLALALFLALLSACIRVE